MKYHDIRVLEPGLVEGKMVFLCEAGDMVEWRRIEELCTKQHQRDAAGVRRAPPGMGFLLRRHGR